MNAKYRMGTIEGIPVQLNRLQKSLFCVFQESVTDLVQVRMTALIESYNGVIEMVNGQEAPSIGQ